MLKDRVAAAALFLSGTLLAACQQAGPVTNGNDAMEQNASAIAVPQIPLPQPPLDREQLLIAAAHAASDYAAGINDQNRQRELADRKFEFHIRFGCDGPEEQSADADYGWSSDKNNAVRVRARPTVSLSDPAVAAAAGDSFEAAEGFWVRNPWLLSAVCPRKTPSPEQSTSGDTSTANRKSHAPKLSPVALKEPKEMPAATTAEPQVAIAQFFSATDPRTMRRSGRSYEATKRLDADDKISGGFDLVLSGRLKALPDGRVIACAASPSGGKPACVISVEFGKVSIQRADTREVLAEWGSG